MTELEEYKAREARKAELIKMCGEVLHVSTDPEGMVRVWLEQVQMDRHTLPMEKAIVARHEHFFGDAQ